MGEQEMTKAWDDHNAAEFALKDVEAAMKSMVDEPYVRVMAIGSGGEGQSQVRAFYRDVLLPQWPDDAEMEPRNRVVGRDHVVDELHLRFTHAKEMDWLLPGVSPTNQKVEMDVVIVAEFQDDLVAGERVYWDQANVLRQVGLLEV